MGALLPAKGFPMNTTLHTPLNMSSLSNLSNDVSTPSYRRSELTPSILHIGLGNFQRAHMAVYLDKLFAMGEARDWAVIGASVRPSDNKLRDQLKSQDWLSTVVELDPTGYSARVTGSMLGYTEIDPTAIVEALLDPQIRIVSLTITEGGYYLDPATGKLDQTHPDIIADAANLSQPKTVFGMLIKALVQRRIDGLAPFTVLSCDNLPGNGDLTRQTMTELAVMHDSTLADWIKSEVCFPNSMVDCITPATTDRERSMVQKRFGLIDHAPVICEPFRQWVIEDNFSAGRPPLEKVGVEFVKDVGQHELMKLRILNAGHASIAYAAALLGYHFVHEAMADTTISSWLRTLHSRDTIPTLAPIPGVDYSDYLESVITRFTNPKIGDTIPRLAADGSDRQPKFIFPTLEQALKDDGSIEGLALEVALWCRYCRGDTENGETIVIKDPLAEELQRWALEAEARPAVFIENIPAFGDLSDSPRFVSIFSFWLEKIGQLGVHKTLQQYIG